MRGFFLRDKVLNSEIQRLYELSLDFLLIATHEGQLVRVNPSLAKALGYSESSLENQSLFNFIHPDDQDLTLKEIQKLASGQVTFNFEVRYMSSDGTYRRSAWSGRADLESGRIYATGRDITDLRATELDNQQTLAALNECAIVARTDLKGKITEVNDRFCEISGYSREELIGKDHRILNSGYHSKDFFRSLWSTIKSGGTWTGDIRNKKKDGSFYWMRTVISPIRDLNRTVTSYITVRFEVTQERRANEETQFILKALGLGVWRYQTRSRQIDYDDAVGELFGMPPKPVDSGQDWRITDSLTAESKMQAIQALNQALNTGKDFDTVVHIQRANGEKRFIAARGKVPTEQVNSNILVSGICWDVTPLKTHEEKLAATLAQVKSLFDSMREGVVVHASDGSIIQHNRAALEILELSSDQLIGRTSLDPRWRAVHEDETDFPGSEHPAMVALRTKHPVYNQPMGLHLPSGEKRWIKINAVPINAGGPETINSEVRVICTFSDITESREFERKLALERTKATHHAKLASLGELSAGVAHEINNPLAIIEGTLPLLIKYREDPERFNSKLETLTKASHRIEKIVKGLRKFSRNTGDEVRKQECLNELVAEALVFTESKAKRHAVSIGVEAQEGISTFCDGVEIEQVLVNLINNGIDAIKQNSERWIKIRLFEDSQNVVLQVNDSGPQIPRRIEDKLFQPFFTTKPVGQGTGLGLSIVKGILDTHGATITLNREFPTTCFEIRFKKLESSKKAS